MNIGNKLRELRMEKGLTQEELADRAELSKGFISRLRETSPPLRSQRWSICCNVSERISKISSPMIPMSRLYFPKKISLKKQTRNFTTPSNGSSPMHRKI